MNDEFYECSDSWEVFTDDSYDNFPQDDVYYENQPYQPPPDDPTQPGYELTRPDTYIDPAPSQPAPPSELREVFPGLYYGTVTDIRAALMQQDPSARSPGLNAPPGSLLILPGRGVNRIRAPSNGQSDIFGYFMFPNCQSNDLQTISKNI